LVQIPFTVFTSFCITANSFQAVWTDFITNWFVRFDYIFV